MNENHVRECGRGFVGILNSMVAKAADILNHFVCCFVGILNDMVTKGQTVMNLLVLCFVGILNDMIAKAQYSQKNAQYRLNSKNGGNTNV